MDLAEAVDLIEEVFIAIVCLDQRICHETYPPSTSILAVALLKPFLLTKSASSHRPCLLYSYQNHSNRPPLRPSGHPARVIIRPVHARLNALHTAAAPA